MALENLVLHRVCLHEVHRRADDRTIVNPTYAQGLLTLDAPARAAFVSRVLSAFRSDAQCMEMSVRSFGPGSVIHTGASLVAADDADFLQLSRSLADGLADAQGSRQIPGGLVVAFDGTVGYPSCQFFGVMKAELHEGFLKTRDLQARFVNDLFLSPKTKLYKIGLFLSDGADERPALPGGWAALVYDSALSASHRDAAALYFHGKFLGLEIPENSAHKVKIFFEKTKDFIRAAPVSESERVDLYNGLYTYLKVDKSATIQVGQFAESYLPDNLADAYRSKMKDERFPQRAIEKDLSEVAGSLRIRRLRFPNRIILSGPPEAMQELVSVESVDGGEERRRWTQITIRGPIEAQE